MVQSLEQYRFIAAVVKDITSERDKLRVKAKKEEAHELATKPMMKSISVTNRLSTYLGGNEVQRSKNST